MDSKKQKKPPEQTRREENTQQLTELKYLKTQLTAKDARIKELELRLKNAEAEVKHFSELGIRTDMGT